MTRIDTLGVIVGVTTCTGIGCIVVVALVTLVATYSRVRAGEWPVLVIVVGRCPGCLAVAVRTVCGK